MLLRNLWIGAVGLSIVFLSAQAVFAFDGEDAYTQKGNIDIKAIREQEKRGISHAINAIKLADPYPGLKTEINIKENELNKLVEKKKGLEMTIQRLQIGLRKKKAEFARNPELLKVAEKQYTQKIRELEDELAETEKQAPALESKLARVTLERQVEEVSRGVFKDDDEDTGRFDGEFGEAIQERFDAGKKLLDIGSLSAPRFR